MEQFITPIILVIYIAINLYVSRAQRKTIDGLKISIDSLKTSNDLMKNYSEVFDPQKIKDFVDIKHESTMIKAENLIKDSGVAQKMAKEHVPKMLEFINQEYLKVMGHEHNELADVVLTVIRELPVEHQQSFLDDFLPHTKHHFIEVLEAIDKDSKED